MLPADVGVGVIVLQFRRVVSEFGLIVPRLGVMRASWSFGERGIS